MEMTTLQELEATYRTLQAQGMTLFHEDKALEARIKAIYNRVDVASDAGDNDLVNRLYDEVEALEAERKAHGRLTNRALLEANKALHAWQDAGGK